MFYLTFTIFLNACFKKLLKKNEPRKWKKRMLFYKYIYLYKNRSLFVYEIKNYMYYG